MNYQQLSNSQRYQIEAYLKVNYTIKDFKIKKSLLQNLKLFGNCFSNKNIINVPVNGKFWVAMGYLKKDQDKR